MPPSETINMVSPEGQTYSVPIEDVAARKADGFTLETGAAGAARVQGAAREEQFGGVTGKLAATSAGIARSATLGASDVALRGVYGDEGVRDLRALQQVNPGESFAGELGGALLTAIPSGGASFVPATVAARIGARVAKTAEGASAVTRIGRAAAGGAVEGGLQGLGAGVSDLALSEDPLTLERAASVLSSRALYGAGVGGAAGTLAKTAEIGLGRAKGAIDDWRAQRETAAAIDDDLAQMDAKQLRAARKVEEDALDAGHKAEIERLEAERVPQRAQVADEIAAFRREVKELRHDLTTDGIKLKAEDGKLGSGELGKIAVKANQRLDNLLGNPTGLAKDPAKALDALQRQENAMVRLLERETELRAAYASSSRAVERNAALDSVVTSLEKNRALQSRIGEVAGKVEAPKPAGSPRLQAIDDAREMLMAGKEKSIAEQMMQGSVFSLAAGAAGAIPVIGPMVAPFIGARAAKLVNEQVFGRMGKAVSEQTARAAKAASAVVDVAEKGARMAPPIATRVLMNVRYAPGAAANDDKPAKRELADVFAARAAEVRSQVAPDPTGKPVMRPDARAALADRLLPIRAVNPLLADRMETIAARKLELLAAALPKRPDIMSKSLGGPDLWRPSDMEMRAWARLAAAVEDPISVFERVSSGQVTTEDARAMREVYPEMLADFTAQLMEQLSTSKKRLPYERRLALSTLTGQPLDPAMDPRILGVLQASFAKEEGAAPPQPQFGSVSKPEGTPAQERAG